MFKIPKSVLVVIYTPELDVLLIRRADASSAYWQSVTGSKDYLRETYRHTAQREVWEETGIDCRTGSSLSPALCDWHLENIYEIYPAWRRRYAPGVIHNVEHIFGLCVPHNTPVRLNPREHTDACWLPYLAAADQVGSYSNAEAILMLPRFASSYLPSAVKGA